MRVRARPLTPAPPSPRRTPVLKPPFVDGFCSFQTGEIYEISHELLVLVDGEALGGWSAVETNVVDPWLDMSPVVRYLPG